MITLYTWKTPNGRKIPILLEEAEIAYEVRAVNIGKDEQFAPEFLRISPNNKIPAIVDDAAEGGPITVFESGAILVYLAEKSGRFLPPSGPPRAKVLEWLFWQVGGLGPMLGQLGFFAVRSKEKAPLAVDRFTEEAERLFGVMERRLGEAEYLGGEYSIADMAAYPWAAVADNFLRHPLAAVMERSPNVRRWLDAVGARPAVQRAMHLPIGD